MAVEGSTSHDEAPEPTKEASGHDEALARAIPWPRRAERESATTAVPAASTAQPEIRTANAMERQAKWQATSSIIQAFATLVAAIAAGAALVAVRSQADGIEEQARFNQQAGRDERLGIAMSALAERDPTAKVGGVTLLVRNVEERIAIAEAVAVLPEPSMEDSAEITEARRRVKDAGSTYTTVLDLVETYLRDPTDAAEPALGLGNPRLAPEVGYGFTQFRNLISMGERINILRDRHGWASIPRPTVSLERAQLFGLQLPGTSFAAFGNGRAFTGIDLRSANFQGSDLSGATIDGAYLRCADMRSIRSRTTSLRGAKLVGADLRGANLEAADLTNADLTDADLRGANLDRTVLTGATTIRTMWSGSFSSPIGKTLTPGAEGDYNVGFERCRENQVGWGPPRSTGTPTMQNLRPRTES